MAKTNKRLTPDEILFIDATELGYMLDRVHRDFTDEDINKITDTYHGWRNKEAKYDDVKGFCKSATLDEIKQRDFILTPGLYAGIPDKEDDGIPFEEKMATLTSELKVQIEAEESLNKEIGKQISKVGFDI